MMTHLRRVMIPTSLWVAAPLLASAQSSPPSVWLAPGQGWVIAGMLLMSVVVAAGVLMAKTGAKIGARHIPGIEASDDAIGRAVEMGKAVVFVPGFAGITATGTIAALSLLRLVAEKCAETGARLIVPCGDTIVTSICRETVEDAYRAAGRHDQYQSDDVYFISREQFAYVAGVNGVMEREHPATVFLQGQFGAESLVLAETANHCGALVISGTDKDTQLPFFVTTSDYTLIGEELYAAGAAISQDTILLGSLRGVDFGRILIGAVILIGVVLELANVAAIRQVLGG
ncbi:MAG: hypothetical protein O3A46_08750 [Candidatus Poribacteria bacterium]|nr:hypothetical protein [Candidatus Poribacteria bacterium]